MLVCCRLCSDCGISVMFMLVDMRLMIVCIWIVFWLMCGVVFVVL